MLMTSEEKSTWMVAAATVFIFGWYTIKILVDAATTPISEIQYQDLLVVMIGLYVALVILGEIALAVITRKIDDSDERDRKIDRFGEYIGGYVLGTGLLVVLGLAMAETGYFWIAHASVGFLVLAELVTAGTKIIVYRRGF
jgi:uncharacterized membrane protein YozB (DUF420 family)